MATARRLVEPDDAADLVQQALVEVLVRYPEFAGLRHPLAYARTVMVRIAANQRHPREIELPDDLADRLDAPGHPNGAHWLGDSSVELRLKELAPKQRACVYLKHVVGLSDHEIGTILRCRPSTVRSQAARGVRTLRQSLEHASTH
jgi:RNA polymerase sigma factor (sigma-70 family)